MLTIRRSAANKLLLASVVALAFASPGEVSSPAFAQSVDQDQDGIGDALEKALLAKFTPFLRFTNDSGEELYRPMDARQYVQWSELQSDGDKGKGVLLRNGQLINSPAVVLNQCSMEGNKKKCTNVTVTPEVRGDRFLSPMDSVPQPGQWARHGFAWNDVLRNRNIGLYGHVTQLRIAPPQADFLNCPPGNNPSSYSRDHVLCGIDGNSGRRDTYYKVEYWQFFGYNGVGKPFDIGDHEGDWCTVQLLIDPRTQAIVQTHHFFHGRLAAYDLRKHAQFALIEGGQTREYRGPNFPNDVSATWHSGPVADNQNRDANSNAQNNIVRIAKDPRTGEFTHPVVYVERGGHEFWPTDAWGFQDAPSHSGNDRQHSYIAATPPNLGEVEHPLAETPDAIIVLQYNGRWGAYSKKNSPPQGPALHDSWTWPAQSSIRWQLPREMGF